MQLSNEQEQGIKAIREWLNNGSNWMFYLGGYAGTGKTTMIQQYINGMSRPPLCLAPTGKAATVLQSKLENAVVSTVHSALYKPLDQDTRKLTMMLYELSKLDAQLKEGMQVEAIINRLEEDIKAEKARLAKERPKFETNESHSIVPGQLVIIDEASMVSSKMMKDLENTGAKVLFVGDPGQLPPVSDNGYFTKNQPDHMLNQIQRQALENPIIRLSMSIRRGEYPSGDINMPEIKKHHKSKFNNEFHEFDQVLAGKNEVRRKVNRMIRKQRGLTTIFPVANETLICLRNQQRMGNFFINGIQCETIGAAKHNNDTKEMEIDINYEGDRIFNLPFYPYNIETHYQPNAAQEPWELRRGLVELDYGYCITVHKSQGSEWKRVLLVDDELMSYDQNFRRRWLYTAVTRAKENLTWLTGA